MMLYKLKWSKVGSGVIYLLLQIKMVTTRTGTDYEFNTAVNERPVNQKLRRSPSTTNV